MNEHPGRPKRYSEGTTRFESHLPISSYARLSQYAKKYKLSKTECIVNLIEQLINPNIEHGLDLESENKQLRHELKIAQDATSVVEEQDQRLLELDKFNFKHELISVFLTFDNTKIPNPSKARDWIGRLSNLLKKANLYGMTDDVAGITTRIEFIHKVIIPDIYSTLDADKGLRTKNGVMWYSFNDFLKNGNKRSPEPPGRGTGITNPTQRSGYEESCEYARRTGEPYRTTGGRLVLSGPNGTQILQETPQSDRLTARKPKVELIEESKIEPVSDPIFDSLMEEAEKEESL